MRLINIDELMKKIGDSWGCDDCKDQCVDEQGYPNCEIQQLKERVLDAIAHTPTAKMPEKYDVIQVNEKVSGCTGCLMVIDEVEEWGVKAFMELPWMGTTYLRLNHDEYDLIGKAVLIPDDEVE